MRYAIINSENKVVNIIFTDQQFVTPRNHVVVEDDSAKVGNTYNPETGTFA